ncbi:glucose-6-phosphate isomerase [Pilimelia terevasa]|uniref:Glucose-6-phosphate isomerase n=1 Tax=Pilimelia terevasa TaxID=53372 RepID=A0A8J3BJF8_9ACTN|nr:glucose-6-phosphate isomerase [Pilimelia terevasa]GGK23912.1 glucose-6-phosphate isomerase [Pilimelia terevasa]
MSDLLDDVEAAAGLAVYGAADSPVRARLAADGVAGLLAAKDPTLWGPAAEDVAKVRLGWLDTFRRSRDLLAQLAELRSEIADLTNVVLCGMGGSSLAPEVICRTLGVPLAVLDTTDPQQIRATMFGGHPEGSDEAAALLRRTVVVVASKSGSTVETDSHRRVFWQALRDLGMSDAEAARHFVVVTDPGSPLEAAAKESGMVVLPADPEVGGRYSALTAFGLVPSALAGVDVAELIDQAEALAGSLGADRDNPALALGAALGDAAAAGRDKLALIDDGTGVVGLGDWAEQLVAESTGKTGAGILPVVLERPDAPGSTGPDVLAVATGGALAAGAVPGGGQPVDLAVNGPLGAHFLAWEYATAVASRVIGVEPFDQPNVAESKENTNRILAGGPPHEEPLFTEGPLRVYAPAAAGGDTAAVLRWLLGQVGDRGYLAVMAYLDRFGDADVAGVRPALAAAGGRPVTFGWGPRFLHSTGQYHKGGPQVGVFLQVTGAIGLDLAVPGRDFTFGQLIAAQAAGDRKALADRGRPLVHIHLADRTAGVPALVAAAAATAD